MGHNKTAHDQLYIYPDGQRYDDHGHNVITSLPIYIDGGDQLGANWGAECCQLWAQVNDSGWGEQYYNNICAMQQTGLSDIQYDIIQHRLEGIHIITYIDLMALVS